MFSMLSNTNCFASPGRFEKSLTDSSGHGALCRLGPFGTESVSPCATVYGSPTPRQYSRYIDTISGYGGAVIPCALIFKRIYYAETSQMCLRPQPGGRASENRRGAKDASLGRPSVFSKACQGWLLLNRY